MEITHCHINLRISLSRKTYVWVCDDHNSRELWGYEQEPLIISTFNLTREELISSDPYLNETIKSELVGWPVSENWRDQIIAHVLHTSREKVQSVPLAGNNVLELFAEYFTERHRNLPRSYVIDAMSTLSFRMVLPADSSIESLKSKIISDGANCESCSICLDEFCAGGEAVCLPCSHAFHGDCIKEWLRTSHYCPLCCYEMPTN